MKASSPSSRSEGAGDSVEEVPSMRRRREKGGKRVARGEATVRVFSGEASLSPMDDSRAPRNIKRKEETWTSAATTRRTSAGDSVWARRRWTHRLDR